MTAERFLGGREYLLTHSSFDFGPDGQLVNPNVQMPKLQPKQYQEIVYGEWIASSEDVAEVIASNYELGEDEKNEIINEQYRFSLHASHEPVCLTVTRQLIPVELNGTKVIYKENIPKIILPLQEIDDFADVLSAYLGYLVPDIKELSVRIATKYMLDVASSMIALEMLNGERRIIMDAKEHNNLTHAPENLLEELLLRQSAVDTATLLLGKKLEREGLCFDESKQPIESLMAILPLVGLNLFRKHGDTTFLAMATKY